MLLPLPTASGRTTSGNREEEVFVRVMSGDSRTAVFRGNSSGGAGFGVDRMTAVFKSPQALTVTSPTPAGATPPLTASGSNNKSSSLPMGAIIGVAVGGAVLLLLAGGSAQAPSLQAQSLPQGAEDLHHNDLTLFLG